MDTSLNPGCGKVHQIYTIYI